MTYLRLKKGHDIGIAGVPQKTYIEAGSVKSVALLPNEFLYVKPKLLVKEGDMVKCGDPLFIDKQNPNIKWASPGGGIVSKIQFGPRRVVQSIEITLDEDESYAQYETISIADSDRQKLIDKILEMNLWPLIRQRPFNKIADPKDTPKSIFVSACNTAPLAVDNNFILDGSDEAFNAGLALLEKLTEGDVHLAIHEDANSTSLTSNDNVRIHRINGPHPVGNVGVLIHHMDPLNPHEVVWTCEPQHVLTLGRAILTGKYDPAMTITIAGPSTENPGYIKTRTGAPVETLSQGNIKEGNHRLIRGDVLTGKAITNVPYLGLYDTSLSCIPESHERTFIGWLKPGSSKRIYSLMQTYFGSNSSQFSFSTLLQGGKRALIPFNAWEDVLPMDILPNPLYRAILAQDIDEMEKLGILEVVEEDVALCSFACPSKIDLGGAIRQGLDQIVKED